MKLPPLLSGTLIRRYKRFLVDVKLDDGRTITAHCPNTGSMLGCSEPGRPVYLSVHDSPKRKYPHTMEIISMPGSLVGINTMRTNKLVLDAAQNGYIPEFTSYNSIRAEATVPEGSRFDLHFSNGPAPDLYVEIKNCTLVRDHTASFPDAVTIRGQKHLKHLISLRERGLQACIFFLIQRRDATHFEPAHDIDPEYARLLRYAVQKGVLAIAYTARVTLEEIAVDAAIPIDIRNT